MESAVTDIGWGAGGGFVFHNPLSPKPNSFYTLGSMYAS